MSSAFDVITVVVSLILLFRNIKNITWSSRYVVYYLFLFFYVLPLILDVIVMRPDYSKTPMYEGFEISYDDGLTRCLYDLAIIYSQIIILGFRRRKTLSEYTNRFTVTDAQFAKDRINVVFNLLIILFAASPIVLTLIFPVDKSILYTFQWREDELFEMDKFYSFIERFTYIGSVCVVIMLTRALKTRNYIQAILYVIMAYIVVCIQGKRSVLFFMLLTYIITSIPGLREKGLDIKSRRRKIFWMMSVSLFILMFMTVFTFFVKTTTRGYDPNDVVKLYTALRIDFFRDDRVRLAIYSILNPSVIKLLDYPGQSLLPTPTWLFPVDYILSKFKIHFSGYSVFLSNALLLSTRYDPETVFATPSIYAELISNISIFGALLFPFISVWFATVADKSDYPFNILVLISYVAFQMYGIPYMMYYYEFTLFMFWYARYGKRFVIGRFGRT